MQTSLARRQRRRRHGNVQRGRGGGGRTIRNLAVALPILLFSSFFVAGAAGFLGAVSAYSFYSRDLPEPKELFDNLAFNQETVVFDRTGKVELARFALERRQVVNFAEVPPVVIDATTAIEDKTFWENTGFDPLGIVAAGFDTLAGNERGASTITQQLVRARLLPESAFEGSRYERKIREIIQSIRLTQAYPGEEGKRRIMAAYLNQNFYGNQAYGIKQAALAYFGVELKDLTLAQAAILAAIPQSPTRFDLLKNSVEECLELEGEECRSSRLVVPADSEIVARRNHILGLMETRAVLTQGDYTAADYAAARKEDVVLTPRAPERWRAPHFVWQVRRELGAILCGPEQAENCDRIDTGGYRIVTTLDWAKQAVVEKWTYAAARAPQAKDTNAALKRRKIPEKHWAWIRGLRGRNIHNDAAAVIDYRTGEVLAYAGSAGYYEKGNKKFQPQFDVLADGWRQPGSAWKPVGYAIGIEDRTFTAASLFMDVVTDFGGRYTPKQADNLERGPVRLRSALQFSLNIPSIKAHAIMGVDHVLARARDFGIRFQRQNPDVGVSLGIGTLETHPIDLLSAYGTIANGGVLMPRTTLVSVTDPAGNRVFPVTDARPAGKSVISPQAAYVITDILAGNTNTKVNPYWSDWRILDGKKVRPAAYKTGTTNENKDVAALGYLAPPKDPAQPALAVGVWMGNSDSTQNKGSLSLDSSAPLWSAILTEISQDLPIVDFQAPDGIVEARIDAHSGMKPGPFTARTITEIFIEGTAPSKVDNTKVALDIDSATGKLWAEGCSGPMATKGFLDLDPIESDWERWERYNDGWIARARRGSGVRGGPEGSRTTYFYNGAFAPYGRSWGAPFKPKDVCEPLPSPSPSPTPDGSFPIETLPPGASPRPGPSLPIP